MAPGETLVPGFRFPERRIVRDPQAQAQALTACALDPAIWDGLAEPTLWGNDGFQSMSASGQGIDGYIHVEQRLTLTGSIAFGETVGFSGETVSNQETARGRRIVQRFEVRRDDGRIAVVSEHVRLLPDLAKMGPKMGPTTPATGHPETIPEERIAAKTLTPDAVATYSRPVGNEIHFDPAFAARYGYRAPLAQGLMTMTWMVAHVADAVRAAPAMTLTARFRRPVFWDDALTLVGERGTDASLDRLCALNADGRIVCDLRVSK